MPQLVLFLTTSPLFAIQPFLLVTTSSFSVSLVVTTLPFVTTVLFVTPVLFVTTLLFVSPLLFVTPLFLRCSSSFPYIFSFRCSRLRHSSPFRYNSPLRHTCPFRFNSIFLLQLFLLVATLLVSLEVFLFVTQLCFALKLSFSVAALAFRYVSFARYTCPFRYSASFRYSFSFVAALFVTALPHVAAFLFVEAFPFVATPCRCSLQLRLSSFRCSPSFALQLCLFVPTLRCHYLFVFVATHPSIQPFFVATLPFFFDQLLSLLLEKCGVSQRCFLRFGNVATTCGHLRPLAATRVAASGCFFENRIPRFLQPQWTFYLAFVLAFYVAHFLTFWVAS